MSEMTSDDLKTIFQEYQTPFLKGSEGKPYSHTIKRLLNQFLIFNFRHKDHLSAISQIFGCNFSLATALQMIKTLHFWNWETEITIQKTIDLWFFLLKRTYASQFEKVRPLSDEYILDIDDFDLSKSLNSLISPRSETNETAEKTLESDQEGVQKSSIFDDPLKRQRKLRRKSKSGQFEIINDGKVDVKQKLRSYREPRTLGQIEEGVEPQEADLTKRSGILEGHDENEIDQEDSMKEGTSGINENIQVPNVKEQILKKQIQKPFKNRRRRLKD